MIKINGNTIQAPSTLQVDLSTIDGETTRNAKGEMIRDVICTKRKLNLEWKHVPATELSKILNLIDTPFFNVEYPDPQSGGLVTRTFYVGDRNLPTYRVEEERKIINGKPTILQHPTWVDVRFNFTEK